jgi:Ca-activated chloride channel family protein
VLNALWVDPLRKQIAQDFLSYVRGPEGRKAYTDAAFRGPDRSAAPMLTRARGFEPVINGTQRSILLPEQVTRTVIAWTALRKRANILSVIDVSGSMSTLVPGTGKSRLEIARAAALMGLQTFNPDTQVGMWVFSTDQTPTTDYRELVPIGPVGGPYKGALRRDAIVRSLNAVQPKGNTGLYDTAIAAYKEAKRAYQPGRLNLVVLMTDGENQDAVGLSRDAFFNDLRAAVDPNRPVAMLTIAYSEDAAIGDLQEMSKVTGGKSFVSKNPADISKVFLAALFGR